MFDNMHKNLEQALLLITVDLIFYTLLYFCYEIIFLDRNISMSLDKAASGFIVRMFFLQPFIELLVYFTSLYLTKRKIVHYFSIIFSTLIYYSVVRGEIVGFDTIFDLGSIGATVPSLLIFFASLALAMYLLRNSHLYLDDAYHKTT